MLRAACAVVVICLAVTVGLTQHLGGVASPGFGDPLPGLTPDELDRFVDGKEEFSEVDSLDQGLGPVFNDASCANCHKDAAVGGGSAILETRFGRTRADGSFDPLSEFGGSLIQKQGIGQLEPCYYSGESVPVEATIVAQRRTTPLFGLGLIDAVPDSVFQQIAAIESANRDGTGGRAHVVMNLLTDRPAVGKFGWKAQVPNLLQFAGDAYLNEMGVTNPIFQHENCPAGDCSALSCDPVVDPEDNGHNITAFADFMTFLAPPGRASSSSDTLAGEMSFMQIGCASCHLPTLRTGRNPIAALTQVTFHPFSDFLLHDMGSLGDAIEQGNATGREMRTAPLWGLRVMGPFLHDGRAATIEQAIAAHDGQGAKARDRFAALETRRRLQLLAFLKSL
jgi:CxxC motif-containing protein (DUF1111 family)